MKSRITWMREGNNTTKFFHQQRMAQRPNNTIWKTYDDMGEECTIFGSISTTIVSHYKKSYIKPSKENIRVKATTSFFNGWLHEAQNEKLMSLVTKEELLEISKYF